MERVFETSLQKLHKVLPTIAVTATHKLQHVPVKDVVVREALSVEKVPEELPQI